ncbi:MAG: phenylalanine--tRNA ligase subunit beta [Planctomycetota bacterium]
MKISYAILKEYCAVALEPKKLADLLTRHGVKVESMESQGDQTVFEFEITANRPDCLSFIGIAREVALMTRVKANLNPKSRIPNPKAKSTPFIHIKSTDLCPMYIGRIIRNVKVGLSPDWLRNHLESLGFRSINNIVDITNWVLMETGQPLHAFDYDKLIGNQIIVRTAVKDEKITAIDGKAYQLTPDMLVIADAQKPVALAGIMGGKETEVTESTKNILLESAYFNPVCIRRTSRRLALSSDSSYRFERLVDPKGVETASQRAAELILELAKGDLIGYQALDYLSAKGGSASGGKYKDRKVSLRTERINRILGITIPLPEIKRILTGLGIKILSAQRSTLNALRLQVPSFRPDLNIEVDIIEELARIYGYDKIPVRPPCIELKVSQSDKIYDVIRTTRKHLVESGYNEAMTNSFWDKGLVSPSEVDHLVGLSAPDGTTDRYIRSNLAKGLLDVFNLNENYLHSEAKKTIRIFEISKTYQPAQKERYSLGIMDNAGFYSAKGALEGLFNVLGLKDRILFSVQNSAETATANSVVTPAGIQNIVGINLDNTPIGYIGNIMLDETTIGITELDFEALINAAELSRQYQPFIRLPAVTRDIAVVIPESVTWHQIETVSRQALAPSAQDIPIEKIEFFDIYRGKQVKEGHKSIAFSLTFRHPTLTLASGTVDGVVKNVIDALTKDLKATLRT